MRILLSLLVVPMLLAALAACGGGGGGGGSSGGGSPGPGGHALPGATVNVQSTGAVAAGQTATFRISVSGAISDIAVFIGPTWEDAVPAQVFAIAAGTWEASAVLPQPLPPGSAVLVRLGFADGSIVETSTTAFPL